MTPFPFIAVAFLAGVIIGALVVDHTSTAGCTEIVLERRATHGQ